ncbi:hypothetical protein [Papillibacter cinnamivorans]|uniref:Uncharacterized protein n=1 Tax=Papillibacter cinnamivorans DSM 12816 TaxID=1122930 RepID=A0A1W2BWN9_9FIRM|nr:hypothetical protein [Papillibacter cinnamivorans]SMC77012.1 hypothetical protein SAMN02745168_2427 [Papillibacter cinnamivorans DSM 12816]
MEKDKKDKSESLDELGLENTTEILRGLEDVDKADCSLEEILAEFRAEKPLKVDIRKPWANDGELPEPDVELPAQEAGGVAFTPEEAGTTAQEVPPGPEIPEKRESDGGNTRVIRLEGFRRAKEPDGGVSSEPPAEPTGKTGKLLFWKRPKAEPEAAEPDEEEQEEEQENDGKEEPADGGESFGEAEEKPHKPPRPEARPEEAAAYYSRGLGSLKLRTVLVLLISLPMCYLTVWDKLNLPLPSFAADSLSVRVFALLVLQAAATFLGLDTVSRGLYSLIRRKPGAETAVAVSCLASLADAATMLVLTDRGNNPPYCALAALALFFTMWGGYLRRRGMKDSCRAAAASARPYLVYHTEENGFFKRQSGIGGFVTGTETPDASDRIFGRVLPPVLLAAFLFSLISSAGHGNPKLFLWCLAATTAAAATYSGTLSFGLPLAGLSRRLFHTGAGLAGWAGCCSPVSSSIVLTDGDLFPAGTVSINGIKVFGDYSLETVTSYAASIIAASGSGLSKAFCELVKTQGGLLRQPDHFSFYENGGYSAELEGKTVLAGSSDFMALMGVSLPRGLKLKSGVFLAVDGSLAGVFAIMYNPNEGIRSALACLMRSKLTPVFAVRDFNITPAMLTRKFKLNFSRCEFPPIKRRLELSETGEGSKENIAAVLCREGLVPYADAAVGGRRLRTAVRASAWIASAGSALGVLMAFYLTYIAAYDAVTPFHLLLYLLMWSVPTFLISGWVNRF